MWVWLSRTLSAQGSGLIPGGPFQPKPPHDSTNFQWVEKQPGGHSFHYSLLYSFNLGLS